MSYNPYGGKYTYGGSLKHYRTKGSKNGISNNPSYKPIGQKAVGRIVGTRPDGTPIYDYGRRSGESTQIRDERRQNNVKSALNSYNNSRSQSTRDRANQQRRINAATVTNAGSRGISSREAAQRQGSRINANNYGNDTTGKRFNRTNDYIGANARKTVNDTKKFVQNTVKNAPETAAKAAKDTRNIFQRGASAVGNWFNKRRAELKTTGKNVGNWLSDRGRDIGKAARTAYEAISNSDERKAYEKAQANFRKNPTAENKKARDAAKKAYDSHLLTRLDRGVKGAPGNISRAARNAAGTAKRGVEAAGRAISNQDEREAYERAEANFRKNPTAENRKARNEAKKAYDSHLVTQASRTATKAGQTVSRAASTVGSAAAEGARKAGETASKLGGQLMAQVKSLPQNVQKKYSKAVRDAQKLINEAPGQAEAALTDLQDQINWEIEKQKKAQQQKTLDSMFK